MFLLTLVAVLVIALGVAAYFPSESPVPSYIVKITIRLIGYVIAIMVFVYLFVPLMFIAFVLMMMLFVLGVITMISDLASGTGGRMVNGRYEWSWSWSEYIGPRPRRN